MVELRFCSPLELSGALNKAAGWTGASSEMFPVHRARRESALVRKYQAANDLLAVWLDQHTVAGPEASVPQSELHGAYAMHCRRSSRRPASKQIFGRRLRALRPGIESAQRTVAGRRAWVYAGINLRDNAGC